MVNFIITYFFLLVFLAMLTVATGLVLSFTFIGTLSLIERFLEWKRDNTAH